MAFSLGMENQDKKTQILMIAVLVIVIGGSLFMVIKQLVGGGKGGRGTVEAKFQCMDEDCGAVFVFDPTKVDPAEMGADPMMMMGMEMAVDCPECGGERCAIAMTQCPACKEYFVSEFSEMNYEASKTGRMPDPSMMGEMVCPHCDTNFREWAKKKRAERKKKK